MKAVLNVFFLFIYLGSLGAKETETKKLNIAVVFDIFFPAANGILTGKVDLAKYLISQGHKVIFIAPERKESTLHVIDGLIPVYYVPGIDIPVYPGLSFCMPWNKKLSTIFAEEKIDVVHLTAPAFVNLVALNEALSLELPVVHTFHTNLYEPKYVMKLIRYEELIPSTTAVLEKTWLKYFFDNALVTTAPSRYIASFLQGRFPGKDIRAIPNGIDQSKFKDYQSLSKLQAKYPDFDPKFSILFTGRISKEKELEVLFSAMTLLSDKKIHLYLVGDGPEIAEYKTLVCNLGINDQVSFLGQIANKELLKSGLIHHSRLVVNPSTTETFGMSVLEAICCKVPVIIPDVPVNREMVKGNGLLFSPGNSQELANAIEKLCYDHPFHAQCLKGAEKMQAEFDLSHTSKKIEELYQEVASHE